MNKYKIIWKVNKWFSISSAMAAIFPSSEPVEQAESSNIKEWSVDMEDFNNKIATHDFFRRIQYAKVMHSQL